MLRAMGKIAGDGRREEGKGSEAKSKAGSS